MNKPRKHPELHRLVCILLSVAILLIIIDLFCSAVWIRTTRYTARIGSQNEELRLVYISDLHGREFGKDNRQLVERIAAEEPELIAMTGDMLPEPAEAADVTELCRFITELEKTAPVCFSLGNTEKAYLKNNYSLLQNLASAGATVLEESWQDVSIDGTTVRIGGLYSYAFMHNQTPEEWESSSTFCFLREFTSTKLPTVLLCHRPDSFFFYEAYRDWDIDLLLCGHTHGGIIRIPFLGGLVASDQGYFPEYDYGQFVRGETTMLITSGFAGYKWLPRFNNRPEIVSVTLTGSE